MPRRYCLPEYWPRCLRHSAGAILATLLLVAVVPADAYGPQPLLHVSDYSSESSDYRWNVDPSERGGAGSARYTLYRGDTRVLTQTLDFTLRDARVADDGTLAGYAYSEGSKIDGGDFVVALVRIDGRAQVLARQAREPSRYLHTDANPSAQGMFVDSPGDLLVIRVVDADVNRDSESWWRYRLSDGAKIGALEPRKLESDNAALRSIIYAQALAATSLVLVQWYRYDSASKQAGTRTALLDADLKSVWSLDLPQDLSALSDGDRSNSLYMRILREGTVLDSGARGFAIWQASSAQRLDFALAVDPSSPTKWAITETTRTSHPGPAAPSVPADLPTPPERQLEHLGRIELAVDRAAGPQLAGLSAFDIDARGRFGVLRNPYDTEASFVLVDGSGVVVREMALDFVPIAQTSSARLAWIAGDRWLLTFDDRKVSRGYWLDAASGKTQSLAYFQSPPIESLVGSGDGGFVALTQLHTQWSIEKSVRAFDAQGRQRWMIEEGQGEDNTISSPEDVTVRSDGDIVVLEHGISKLKRFDRNGRPVGLVNLETAWKRKPNYVSGIESDQGGGVIVYDFQSQLPVVRMHADGSVLSELLPRLADGQRFDIYGNVQSAPDGRLWTSDGSALLRLTPEGVVDQVIGSAPGTDELGDIAAVQVTASGRIYAVDERSGAVHVHGVNGERLQICRPAVGDYDGALSLPSITVSDTGEVYAQRNDVGKRPDFLHYSANCERLGIVSLPVDTISQDWVAQPGGRNRWVIGYPDVYRVGADDAVLATLQRTASGRWLDDPGAAAAAPDGSLAVVSESAINSNNSARRNGHVIAVYSANGTPVRELPAPRGVATWAPLAFDGNQLALVVATDPEARQFSVWIMDAITGSAYRVRTASPSPAQAFFVHPENSEELWLFDGKRHFDRYRMP